MTDTIGEFSINDCVWFPTENLLILVQNHIEVIGQVRKKNILIQGNQKLVMFDHESSSLFKESDIYPTPRQRMRNIDLHDADPIVLLEQKYRRWYFFNKELNIIVAIVSSFGKDITVDRAYFEKLKEALE